MRIFYFNIAALLSGEFIPLVILPFLAEYILKILPFRYTLSFPIEILIGRLTNYDIYTGFAIGMIWLVALYFIYKILYSISIRKYAAEGI
jgi:ABC-2 type transport system permease protein